MAEDPFEKYAGRPADAQATQASAPSTSVGDEDPFEKYAGRPSAQATPASAPSASASSSDPFEKYAGRPGDTPTESAPGGASSSPDNGQPDADIQHLYSDSSQPWYKRAW